MIICVFDVDQICATARLGLSKLACYSCRASASARCFFFRASARKTRSTFEEFMQQFRVLSMYYGIHDVTA